MAKAEFVQLAYKYEPIKYSIGGWFISEKLDGMRCIWDGGVTRGMPKSEIPWANNTKDSRYKEPPIATGLWSRLGNIIHAPDWWLDNLPSYTVDGELYCGRNKRQFLMSTVKDLIPCIGWEFVSYHIFDLVPAATWLADRVINTTNFKKELVGCHDWWVKRGGTSLTTAKTQYQTAVILMERLETNDVFKIHPQTRLPYIDAESIVDNMLNKITDNGGEGLIVRSDMATYRCERSHMIQKVKKLDDAEGTVIGYKSGRETDLGSKLLGKMGALILRLDNGRELMISGFTDDEREMNDPEWCINNPDTICPNGVYCKQFPLGATVTFRYRGLSNDGIPQEARYWRRRD